MLHLLRAGIHIAILPLLLSSVLQDASAANSLVLNFGELVQELAVLAVHVGFLVGGLDERKYALRLAENSVHFLETAVGGFGVEEVDDREDGSVTINLLVFLFRRIWGVERT